MVFEFVIDGKKRIERTIEEIVEIEDKTLTFLGVASGMNLGHCLYIASKYCNTTDNFLKDVQYYHISNKDKSLNPKCAMTIEFYK